MTFIPYEAQYLTQMASDEHQAGKHCCGDLLSVEDQAYNTKKGALTTVLRDHFNNDNGRLFVYMVFSSACLDPGPKILQTRIVTSTRCVVGIYH